MVPENLDRRSYRAIELFADSVSKPFADQGIMRIDQRGALRDEMLGQKFWGE
jgi:hypothetical protein